VAPQTHTNTNPIGITVLGATGSIGVSTLDVIARHPGRYRVIALTANNQIDRLFQQCKDFQPEYAVCADEAAAGKLEVMLKKAGLDIQVLAGEEGLETVASLPQVQYVMAAIVGAVGLRPTLAAARAGKRVLLANKEVLVMSGKIFMDEVKRNNAELLPIDSEHNAIFQAMPTNFSQGLENLGVRRILLTASGGPFRELSTDAFSTITPEQACRHPNWDMGQKISVDSATMMNKGLEVIEACWLFATEPQRIQVVVHPQSVIHSMVEYADGSVLAQLGNPDMRTPIAHALAWPERIESGVESLNLFEIAHLDFEAPNMDRFPCLALAFAAMDRGGTAPAILNAANEVAVQGFLQGEINFTTIPKLIDYALSQITVKDADSLEIILEADQEARRLAQVMIGG
jgi:1-deoxy-D-xylulose-5-phosphate reductoisomerase